MTDDDPLDLAQVAKDDAAIEALRTRSVRPDDSALELLRDLLVDVEADLPTNPPIGRGSTVLRLAAEPTTDPRVARGGAIVALVTAGLVALGGVAAASTTVAPGSPLHGLGEAVRSAAGALVTAVKPPAPERAADPAARPTAAPTPATTGAAARPTAAPGPSRATQVRSAAAARQVVTLLDEAEQLLADGRPTVAEQRLDAAERRLADVAEADAAALRDRLRQLRAQVEAALAQTPKPAAEPRGTAQPEPAGRGEPARKSKPAGEPREPAKQKESAASPGAAGRGGGPTSEASRKPGHDGLTAPLVRRG